MACNGYNHPVNCQCGFKGGRSAPSQLPKWGPWRASSVRRRSSGPNATCPKCFAPVFYMAMRSGGGAYFDTFGPPWDKHPCTDVSKAYSPFNAAGKPKLRNRRSEFERDGWLPLFIRHVEVLVIGALVHAATLDDPSVLHFGLATEVTIDTERPIYFRRPDPMSVTAEISFFPKESSLPVTLEALVPCLTEMELRIHLSSA